MGTGRTLNKAPRTRPKKNARDRRRREKVQAQRLVTLGVPADTVAKMNAKEVRQMAARPAKLAVCSEA